jgi:hypothetical protein
MAVGKGAFAEQIFADGVIAFADGLAKRADPVVKLSNQSQQDVKSLRTTSQGMSRRNWVSPVSIMVVLICNGHKISTLY